MLTLLTLPFPRWAAAQPLAHEREARPYQKQIWKAEHGLPSNTIQALLQTRGGYRWIGTRARLARFDGVKFTVFNRGNASLPG